MTSAQSRRSRLLFLTTVLWVVSGALALRAHGFWVRAVPDVGTNDGGIRVALGFGERFPETQPVPDNSEIDARLIDPAGTSTPIAGLARDAADGLYKAVVHLPMSPGAYVVEAVLRAKAITYTGSQFQDYLNREGLTDALSFRKSLHEEALDARESATMFAKAIFRIGASPSPSTLRPIGSKVELVPLGDPTTLRVGDTLHVKVFYIGAPQVQVNVTATRVEGAASFRREGLTNSSGEADLTLPEAGTWLIRAAQMLPGSAHAGEPTEWQSFWASLIVDVQPKR